MHKTLITSALAALSLAVTVTPALAETISIAVPYDDLDLSSEAGMTTLGGRLDAAAKRICGKVEVRRIKDGADQQRCMQQTHSSVTLEIARLTGNPRVLALNTGAAPKR